MGLKGRKIAELIQFIAEIRDPRVELDTSN